MAGFDFSRIANSGVISGITEPSTLFDALPNKAGGYGYLRAVQKTVLDSWAERRDDRDLVIKTNTGGGKTIVGMLILQCCINEGKGPALYLAPDPHLAGRAIQEASNLGLATVGDPEAVKFVSGEAICVTTMRTLVNGKTRFGLLGSNTRQPVKVGSVVVDDAHAALALMEQNSRLTIPAAHDAHEELLKLFAEDLESQSANAYLDIKDGDRSAVLRIPFWAWRKKQAAVLNILREYRTDPEFEWSWPLVSDLLPLCQAAVSADSIEILPPCPPIEKFPSFAEAERRIFLTATLADDSVLVTHFDANATNVAASIVPASAADLGDRLVLAPQEVNPSLTHEQIRSLSRDVADSRNVVVLVPSWRQAGEWADEADLTVSKADEISAAVERLKDGHVGLVVIVNRYDGIDLPDEACRLLVIDSLPFAFHNIERREAVALRDSEAMVTRQLQRLEQGIGRGVRGRDDRCAVLILGPRLTRLVARRDVANRLSQATQAQLNLSRQVAAQLEGSDIPALHRVIMQVINGDRNFRTLSREALIGATYGPALVSPVATHLRDAYNCAVSGRADQASKHSASAVDAALASGDKRLAGWIGETHASYLDAVDQVAAQQALTEALRRNPSVLRPLQGLDYQRISSRSAQSVQASSYLTGRYASGQDLVVDVDAILADIAWDRDRTDDAEAALAELGLHLGFVSQRPEQDFGIGSDILWALNDQTYAVIEAKTGSGAPEIWKKDINQLAGSANWCGTEYGSSARVIPILVHPSRMVERTGTPPAGTRVITETKLSALKHAVREYARALAREDQYRVPSSVDQQLRSAKLDASSVIQEFSLEARRSK